MILIPILMTAGIVLGIFLGILLLTLDRGNRKANRLLGIIMIISSVCLSDFALSRLGLYNILPHAIGIAPTMLFLIGPLFYFYIGTLTGHKTDLRRKDILHFIPFILLILYRLPFFFHSAAEKLDIYQNDHFFKSEHKIIILIQAAHAVIYLVFIKRSVSAYASQFNSSIAERERINLVWIKRCLTFLSLIFVFILPAYALTFVGLNLHSVYSAVIPVLISLTILTMGFTGLREPIIFPQYQDELKGKKYEKSTLKDDKADEYLGKLLALMETEKLYLQGDLTLQMLAERMSVLPNHLSQVINDRTGQNFFDFVNSYRIKTAQRLLSGPEGELLTISAIGFEAGFNSKSSFNSAFKKHTGLTPSQYKSQLRK